MPDPGLSADRGKKRRSVELGAIQRNRARVHS
jgi:hypothetical protein